MAEVAIYPRRRMGSMIFDAVVSEDHTSEVDITQHKVERGVTISDHKEKKPKQLTISAAFSNSPFESLKGNVLSASGVARIQGAWEELKSIQEGEDLVEIQTGLELYRNMAIKSLSVSQDASTANALLFSATLIEVRFVGTRTLQTPIEILKSGETKDRAASKVDRGPVAPKPGPQGSSLAIKAYGLG